jgi:hypothetical protein
MTIATIATIKACAPVREAFAGHSTGSGRSPYYENKGAAMWAFETELRGYALQFDCYDIPDNAGSAMIPIVNGNADCVGYAKMSWYRMPSGRYEFIGYIA